MEADGGAQALREARREVLPDAEALARRAAELVTDILAAAAGQPRVCLAGGSTPKRLYELLASPPLKARVPWQRTHWFWGDERFVPPDHKDSNYRMVEEAMLAKAPVAADHIHPIATQGTTPEKSAAEYERGLQSAYGGSKLDATRPLFDVTLLGIGDDGHTASLFPGVAALTETVRWTAAVIGAKPEPRITLTYPALNSSRHVLFVAAGAAKFAVLQKLARGEALPAAGVRPVGELHWMLDRAAAEGS